MDKISENSRYDDADDRCNLLLLYSRIGLTIISISLLLGGAIMCLKNGFISGYYARGGNFGHTYLSGHAVIYFGLLMAGGRLFIYYTDRKQEKRERKIEQSQAEMKRDKRSIH